jgi:hypothetical protein
LGKNAITGKKRNTRKKPLVKIIIIFTEGLESVGRRGF